MPSLLCRALAPLLMMGAAAPALAGEPSGLRLYVGGAHYRWRTVGEHGHLRECRSTVCDDEDWGRANLDNALGLRLGLERGWRRPRGFELALGGELDLLFTEYNLSQRDVVLGAAFVTASAAWGGGRGALVGQAGLGGFVSGDRRGGAASFVEAGMETTVGAGARLRLAARRLWLGSLAAEEASLTLRTSPATVAWGGWQVGMGVGGVWPGLVDDHDAGLSPGALWELRSGRPVGAGGNRVGVLLGSGDRESRTESLYGTVPGNQRGREVWEIGGWWDRRLLAGRGWELRGGLTARAADWRDDGPLLLGREGEPLRGRLEAGVGAPLEVERRIGEGVRVVAAWEPVYWPRLDLVEGRARLGLVVGQGPAGEPSISVDSRCQAWPCQWAKDLGALVSRPARLDRRDWRVLGLGTLAVGLVGALDEPVREAVQSGSHASRREAAEAFRPVSFWGPVVGSAAVWAGASLVGQPRTAEAAAQGLESVLLTVLVVVPALKEVTGRARPAAERGATYWRPFSEHKSLPSGEIAQAFALATVAQEHRAALWLRGVLWGFAGAVVWNRLELDRHWASDAVAGALVGVVMGRWVVGRGAGRRGEVVVTPVVVRGGAAIRVGTFP